jgi:transcriptional regulator with XRE-family HTH domain
LIYDARIANKFTLSDLADRSGVSGSRISRIERGDNASEEVWQALAEALGLEFVPSVPFIIRKREL